MILKKINIGECVLIKVKELDIPMERICNFLKIDEKTVKEMYNAEVLPTDVLLRWSKLLEYDFFRLYSQHLIIYAPPASQHLSLRQKTSQLPQFRKNLYSREIIAFILELLETGKKTKTQVIEEYKIPKTTLYKWIEKYEKNSGIHEEEL